MPKLCMDRVVSKQEIAENIFKLTMESDTISVDAKPGQFVNIKCGGDTQTLLRRPVSICAADRRNGTYDLVFQVKGEGTALLALKKPGEVLDILGPLGNGFDLNVRLSRIAVIGGGIGIFPLLFVLNESKAIVKRAYLGFRTKKLVMLEEEFKQSASSLEITTDDGSYGKRGLITELLKRDMATCQFDMIYSCGPVPMLKKVIETASENGMDCQVSLEQRMGCGFGACLVCACKTRAADGENGWQYSHVCKDGPVFSGKDVMFQEVSERTPGSVPGSPIITD